MIEPGARKDKRNNRDQYPSTYKNFKDDMSYKSHHTLSSLVEKVSKIAPKDPSNGKIFKAAY